MGTEEVDHCVFQQVFKDKGGDRKQKQDQLKMEKLTLTERVSV